MLYKNNILHYLHEKQTLGDTKSSLQVICSSNMNIYWTGFITLSLILVFVP